MIKKALGTRLQVIAKTVFVLMLLLVPSAYSLTPIFAADGTTSASVKDKLKSLQAEIASRASQIQTELNKKLQNRAYVGTIKSKSQTSLTILTQSGEKIVNTNEYTEYTGKITDTNYIAALGDVDEQGVMQAKKVIKLATPETIEKVILWGKLLNKEKSLLTLKTPTSINAPIALTTKTKGGVDQLKIGKVVIVVALKAKEATPSARFIFIPN